MYKLVYYNKAKDYLSGIYQNLDDLIAAIVKELASPDFKDSSEKEKEKLIKQIKNNLEPKINQAEYNFIEIKDYCRIYKLN